MITKLFHAKHWQIFLLTVVIPVGIQQLIPLLLFQQTNLDAAFNLQALQYLPILIIAPLLPFFLWMWSITIGLQSKLPSHVQLPLKRFKFAFFFVIGYSIFFTWIVSNMLSSIIDAGDVQPSMVLGNFAIIAVLHFMAMFGIIYCFRFTVKTIKSVVLKQEAKLGNYLGMFFQLWLFPIGIWFIQPQINSIAEDLSNSATMATVLDDMTFE